MRYSCPKCKDSLLFQKTFNGKILITCENCEISHLNDYKKNYDEIFLDFLDHFDSGTISTKKIENSNQIKLDDLVRKEQDILELIKGKNPDELTKKILFTKKDYISYFNILKEPDPKFGRKLSEIGIDPLISKYFQEKGITKLYKFQEQAFEEILFGNDVVITAPTASGKTEAFLIPIIQKIKNSPKENSGVVGLFVYPTKALAQDQFPKIASICSKLDISVSIFDGDTKANDRRKILENPPQLIITNFDILHYHLLNRTNFSTLLPTIKYLVVDEAHIYSGIFGSNVHYIIKRLKRLCKKFQCVAASATLDEAKKFCEELFGTEMIHVAGSGKKGEVDFVMIFPSLRNQRALMVDLVKKLTDAKHKTMIFSNSHRNSELLAIQSKKQKINIKVHRAGLVSNYRKKVEQDFKNDKLIAISCTPTLELGIDVGNVDGVISSTIPINRLVQRIGRAARKGQRGFAILALGNDPISQYYKNHPQDYFEDKETIFLDPKNPFVEEFQVLAMACDRPLSKFEIPEHKETVKKLEKDNKLVFQNNRYVPNFQKIETFLQDYSIRGIGSSIDIFLNGKKVGDRVLPIALEELHESAIYFLAGIRYKVISFNYPEENFAKLSPISKDHPYYTKALTEEWPTIETIYETRMVNGMEVGFCKLHILKKVYGYVNIELGQEITQGKKVLLEKPLEYNFITKGLVFHAPRPTKILEETDNPEYVEASGYHATEHVLIEGSNMITGGVSQDLGGISLGNSGLIFIYDGAIGGNGASRALFERLEKVLIRSKSIIEECPCKNEAGCPRCTFSYRCGNNNEFLHKKSSLEILKRINEGEKTKLEEPMEGDRPLV